MALSNPRCFFGIHNVAPYNRATREFFGTLKVLGDSSINLAGELISLNGGSSKFPFKVEDGLITTEINLVGREYPNFLFELFLGKAPVDTATDSTGDVSALANATGTSVSNGTTGIASIDPKSADEGDLRFGSYVVKAVSATTVDIFVGSDIDFGKSPAESYENDLLKITPSPVTIADTGATVDIDDFGLTITSGSGTIAFDGGFADTATFQVLPPHTGSTSVTIGGSGDVFPAFGMIAIAKKQGDFSMVEFDMFNVKAVGLPIGLTENAFSEWSVTAQAFQDTVRGGVFTMRTVKADA